MKRIVLLDDYQGVALDYGGWDRVPDEWQLVGSSSTSTTPTRWSRRSPAPRSSSRCASAPPFPAAILDRLPELKLLITTGMANAAIDVAAAGGTGSSSAAPG